MSLTHRDFSSFSESFFCYQHFFIFLFFSHTTQHNIQNTKTNKKKNRHILNISRSNQKGGEREGQQEHKSHSFIQSRMSNKKTLPSINGRRPGPTDSRRSHDTICRRLRIQYVFLHMCGVNQSWIIVFFTAVKSANNILFCIELIQRPESSLRRHKLGLTDQSIHSNDDKTRFTCVHRLMTTGHSQNICRKVPGDVVLHIWQFKFDCSFILNLL